MMGSLVDAGWETLRLGRGSHDERTPTQPSQDQSLVYGERLRVAEILGSIPTGRRAVEAAMTHPLDRQPRAATDATLWERRTVVIRDWIQILAVIATAGWAYFHFRTTEAPAGARNFAMSQQLDWERVDSSSCYAVVKGGVENLSSSGIRITKVGWKVWLLDRPPLVGAITYQNPDVWASTAPIDSLTYTDGPFVGEYPPQAKTEYALTWRVRQKPGLALFKVELFPEGSAIATDWFYAWDEICNGV